MKTKHLLLLVLVAAFSSCSSAYRIGQTPDDVYYSPAPPPPVEYVTTDNQQGSDVYTNTPSSNIDDLAIRRGITDPIYRSNISLDFGFGYNPYDYYGYGSPLYSPYSSYYNPYSYPGVTFYSHNSNYYNYYSPFSSYYYSPVNIYTYTPPAIYPTGPRTYNLGAYNNVTNTNNRIITRPVQTTNTSSAPVRTFPAQTGNTGNRGNRGGVGNLIRNIFSPSDNNTRSSRSDNSNNSSSSRSSGGNSGGSSSSHSSGGGSAPVRSFR